MARRKWILHKLDAEDAVRNLDGTRIGGMCVVYLFNAIVTY